MKKITILFSLVVCFTFAASAQQTGQIRVGAGLVLGTQAAIDEGGEKAGIGINIGGEYFVTDIISIAPSYTTFFKSDIDGIGFNSSLKVSSFNIDGRYYFMAGDLQLYGLAGLSFASGKSTNDVLGVPFKLKTNETGLNLGVGIVLPLADKLNLTGQVKYNTPLEQLVVGAGILFTVN